MLVELDGKIKTYNNNECLLFSNYFLFLIFILYFLIIFIQIYTKVQRSDFSFRN